MNFLNKTLKHKMKPKWEYQGESPSYGKIYHKNNDIMVIYSSGLVRLWKNIQNDKKLKQGFYPCFAERCLEKRWRRKI